MSDKETPSQSTETRTTEVEPPLKRKFADGNTLSESDFFMATAVLASKRSEDPVTQVGACVVDQDNNIVGIGYNRMPRGCHDEKKFPWDRKSKDDYLYEAEHKGLYVCHAEMNAIMNKIAADVKGCTMYVVLFPCNECAKIIIQAGIKEIVYLSDDKSGKKRNVASKKMLDAAGVTYREFECDENEILIEFRKAKKRV